MPRKPLKQRTLSVTVGCEPSDFAAWKKATRLSDVVTERLAKMPRDEQHEAEADFGEPGRYDLWRRQMVEQLLNAELIQGRHAIYAAAPGEPPHEINGIAHEIMVGLTLHSATNSAKGKGRELINIRLKLDGGSFGTGETPGLVAAAGPTQPFSKSRQERGVPAAAQTLLAQGDFPSAKRATSYEDLRADAIKHLYATYPNFEKAKLSRRIEMMVDYVDTHHPDVDTSWGFERSSYYSTVRKLRKKRKLPSKSVQDE